MLTEFVVRVLIFNKVYIYVHTVIPETSRLAVRPIQWAVDAHVGKATARN